MEKAIAKTPEPFFSETALEAMPFVGSVLAVVAMIIISAIGSTIGATKSAASASMVANRSRDIVTKAYLPVLLASAGFVYSMIVTSIAMPHITPDISGRTAGKIICASLVYGTTSLFTGIAFGMANKGGIVRMSEHKHLFISMLIVNSTIELPAVFALICSILIMS
ncbi:V-type H+-transporting ATPase 16kDa proteolipid subunit [Nematocida sp. AWRm80]|nr:V-type H+-transporting ATPase 16kDa proteolipid subunit [Nematocida sp. AWRm80]